MNKAALARTARTLVPSIAVYWLFLSLMFGSFSVAAMVSSPDPEGAIVLVVLALVTFGGVAVGQILALLRLRDWVLVMGAILWWTFGSLFGTVLTVGTGTFGAFALVVVWLLPIFVTGGLWSLRVNRALFAAWIPILFASGAAISVAESTGQVAEWHAGNKWAVWDAFTFAVLALAIVLLLGFLVVRESSRLELWRAGAHASLAASLKESGRARPRPSLLGWILLGILAMGLASGTAVLSPYLWRTGPDEGESGTGSTGSAESAESTEPSERKSEETEPRRPRRTRDDRPALEKVREDLEPALEKTIAWGFMGLLTLILLALGLLLTARPIKRLLLVELLRRPLGRTSNTRRIANGWRLVEVALGDLGVEPRPGEPAESLCARAKPKLAQFAAGPEVLGLEEAAEIRDRVAYGLGIGPQDVAIMDRVAQWAYDTVWDRLGDRGQIKALYRGL